MSANTTTVLALAMSHPNFALLYVDDALISARFYADILEIEPVEAQAAFALFVLRSGLKLGLWAKSDVLPTVTATSGGSELAIALKSEQEFEQIYQNWQARGVVIAQVPTSMDFGLTFVALDPDGHRLRVFVPAEALAAS
jgi:catechol 2,3-dioxygenase-like lactoylglutathione lyase family enzyme